eukprot:672245-Lingulodinium_polyedra.AAC.1
MSPFKTRPWKDLATCFTETGQISAADEDALAKLSRDIFSGLGQSKVREDGNKEICDAETFTTKNKALLPTMMWDTLRSRKVLEKHGRQELDPRPGQEGLPGALPKVPRDLYTAQGHQ